PLASRVPFLGAALRDRAASTFLRSLLDLHQAGVPIDRAVETAAGSCAAPFGPSLAAAAEDVRRGEPLVPALARTGSLDATTLAILGPAESTGTLLDGLGRAATLTETRLERTLTSASAGPGALLYALAVILVAWAAYDMFVLRITRLL
ncbi:MAG TPA: type II secretion system F family protein, partial [Planctomycetota bacterium]|nr:type II secretion system F family protein [Planctomycetota bacterium]